MEQRNTNMSVARNSMHDFAFSQQQLDSAQMTPGESLPPPLRFAGGNLGLGNVGRKVFVRCKDASGATHTIYSVEWVLRNIEHFVSGYDQLKLLASAALHYSLDPYALTGADFEPKWNVLDDSGTMLLAEVSHLSACEFADNYAGKREYGAAGEFSLRIQRASRDAGDERHEGPLVLLHHNLGVTDFEGVAVKSHAGRCGMMLEEVLWRLDQFSAADQADILAGLTKHFDLGLAHTETAGAA